MKICIGKQIEGPIALIPSVFFFGGMLFINGWRRSVMIPLPQWFIDCAALLGIECVDT